LRLSANQISDIQPLSALRVVDILHLQNNKISDIRCLTSLAKLTSLRLGHNRISDISVLATISPLHLLYMESNEISDISHLTGLTHLEIVELDNNRVQRIPDLSLLKRLDILKLRNNRITDISGLARVKSLSELRLDGNSLNRAAYGKYLPLILQNNPHLERPYSRWRLVFAKGFLPRIKRSSNIESATLTYDPPFWNFLTIALAGLCVVVLLAGALIVHSHRKAKQLPCQVAQGIG